MTLLARSTGEDLDELLPLDPICPHCKGRHDVGEAFTGSARECRNCGAVLQATDNGERMWFFVEYPPPLEPLTGRQRTRRLWRKRGRR